MTYSVDEEHYTHSLVSPANISKSLTVAQPRGLSFNVTHRQKPYWPIKLVGYSVQVSAKFKTATKWQEFDSGDLLGKKMDLLFRADTNVPAPFQVYWQVVNTGEEAIANNGLRGEIFPSQSFGVGGLRQKEYTSYTGVHWVECFIVKNGDCVARSGEFVVRIK